jgi:opacity protein-like surface antigen
MTEVSAGINREVYETTLSSASSYVGTTYDVAVVHDIRPDLRARVALAYSDNDYRGGGRNDNVISAVGGLRYYFLPNFYVGADYTYLQRDSSSPLEDYDENLVFIRLGADLAPGYEESALANAAYDDDLADGFYLGVQAGLGNLSTELAGTRGAGGTLLADFGDIGYAQGGFAGYDFDIGNWRLGIEGEAEIAQSEWDHTRAPGGRVFSVEKENTYGGALRLGRVLMHGNSVYGRFGVVRTEFDTDYRERGRNVDEDQTLTGMRFGGGMEAPISGGLLARMDYTYTSYEDYDVPTNSGPDNFANNETLLRVGLAYRFGQEEPAEPPAPADFDGAYFGFQGGYGNLHTDVIGPRNAGSTLEAEFSDDGALGGAYAGFGHTFGDVYLGVEADGEISDITWDHERDPTGRTYSVQREASVGGSLRLGYVVNNSALLYLRGGGVLTRFETKFDRGMQSVRLDELEPGWRVGGGIEAPMTENIFLRMDYSYAAYDGYEVNYVTGQDHFDNSESLLRVGVAYRF